MLSVRLIACAALAAAGCAAVPSRPDDAVRITVSTSAEGRLQLHYRAPPGVQRLQWVDRDPRAVELVRTGMLRSVAGCGRVEGDDIVLGDAEPCAGQARFEVVPRVLASNAMNEAAQPSSEGGVLLHTRYYAAVAPGHALHWRFEPPAGGYVLDAARAWTTPRDVAVDAQVVDQALATLDREASWRALHASHGVFIGRMPLQRDGELLWARDPALPAALAEPVAQAAGVAMRGYEAASGRPAGGAAIVMLRADEGAGFHGDRSDDRLLRLSFNRPSEQPSAPELDAVRQFVAHEIAHLWNHGVFDSDMGTPWLHEGDADWAALLVLHEQGLLSDDGLRARLQAAVNGCLLVRGTRAAATLNPRWNSGEDEPYACGTALQLLSWAAQHARDPGLRPLQAWGAMHRAHPRLDAASFARQGDGAGGATLQRLLLEPGVPFDAAYVTALAAYLPLLPEQAQAEDAPSAARAAGMLVQRLQHADCGQVSFWTLADHIALDANVRCSTLPAGARLVAVAGEPLFARPRAAWHATRAACAGAGTVTLGLKEGRSVKLECPAALPPLPATVIFAPDALQRIGLAR